MSDLEAARKREMERVIAESLEEDVLRCPSCGRPDCLGLCADLDEPVVEQCWTCHATNTVLDASWGPFCVGTDCKAIAEREADQAAEAMYG